MKRKIEPGCLCYTINAEDPRNNGVVVTAEKFVGRLLISDPVLLISVRQDIWKIDRSFVWFISYHDMDETWVPFAPEMCLMRIDGYEPEIDDVPEKQEQEIDREKITEFTGAL